jgi:hypothetical protein
MERKAMRPLTSKKRTKKSDKTGIMVAGAAGALLLIIVLVVSQKKTPVPKPVPVRPERQYVPVNLPESKKMEMYKSLCDLKAMLGGSGGNPQRSNQILCDRYKVSVEVVQSVEAEGRSRGWPGVDK